MKKMIRLRTGEPIPDNAKYVSSKEEHDYDNATYEWRPTPGIMGNIPIFGTEMLYRTVHTVTFHYYEVEE